MKKKKTKRTKYIEVGRPFITENIFFDINKTKFVYSIEQFVDISTKSLQGPGITNICDKTSMLMLEEGELIAITCSSYFT